MKNKLLKMLAIIELIEQCNADIINLQRTVEKYKNEYPNLANDRVKKIYNRLEVKKYLEKKLQILKTEL